jgi:hypothetical protein
VAEAEAAAPAPGGDGWLAEGGIRAQEAVGLPAELPSRAPHSPQVHRRLGGRPRQRPLRLRVLPALRRDLLAGEPCPGPAVVISAFGK